MNSVTKMMQKRLSGELVGWDPEAKTLRVRFRKWWETGRYTEATATFTLDPYAMVVSAYHGSLPLSELHASQRVTVTYVTGMGTGPIAKTLTISDTIGAEPAQITVL